MQTSLTFDGPEFDNFGGGDNAMSFGWRFFLKNLDGCSWMDECRSDGAPFNYVL
jgi:hypothetical protein